MNSEYLRYTSNEQHFQDYNEYQEKYRHTLRESDRVLLDIIGEIAGSAQLSVADIGCSTGNLLYHLKQAQPGFRLCGVDMVESVLDSNRSDPQLTGIEFREGDIVESALDPIWDIIVFNAVFFALDDVAFDRAVRNISTSLKPGGYLLAFDFFNAFRQNLSIIETTPDHPDGLGLYVRSRTHTNAVLEQCGFQPGEFRWFEIPIDLPLESPDQTSSYTVKDTDGNRLLFRGSIYQPWQHLITRKLTA
jgi:SAM-dependent methyltransferase